MNSITITDLTAAQLRPALARVLPHRGTDDFLPGLTRVQLTIHPGCLLIAATDRYTLAVARLRASTSLTHGRARFTVPGTWAEEVLGELPTRAFATAPLALSASTTSATVTVEPLVDAATNEEIYEGAQFTTIPAWDTHPTWDTQFWDWEPTVRTLLGAEPDPHPAPIAGRLLGRFAMPGAFTLDPGATDPLTTLTPGPDLPTLSVHNPGGGRPLVLLAPDFLGLLPIWRPRADESPEPPSTAQPAASRAAWSNLLTTTPGPTRA